MDFATAITFVIGNAFKSLFVLRIFNHLSTENCRWSLDLRNSIVRKHERLFSPTLYCRPMVDWLIEPIDLLQPLRLIEWLIDWLDFVIDWIWLFRSLFFAKLTNFSMSFRRQYCSRKLHRLRKALKFPQGTRNRYQGKALNPEMVTNAKFLELHLFVAERAWSYAMELKQETGKDRPRKKFHMLRKFKRAALWSSQLVKICDKVQCDARYVD